MAIKHPFGSSLMSNCFCVCVLLN